MTATVRALPRLAPIATASGALVTGCHNPVDAGTSGNLTMTLPAAPADGATLTVEKLDSSVNTVTCSGSIRGVSAQTHVLWFLHETAEFVAHAGSWWVPNGYKSKVGLDQNYASLALTTVPDSTAAITLNFAQSPAWDITLTAAAVAITPSGALAGKLTEMVVLLRQDAIGGRTVTWPGSVTTVDNSPLLISLTPNSHTIVNLMSFDGGAAWTAWSTVAAPSSGGLTRTAVQTANYALVAGNAAPFDTTAGSLTATLPNAPADRSQVWVGHAVQGASNTVTVACAGADTLDTTTGPTSLTLTTLNQAVLLQYDAASHVWARQANYLPLLISGTTAVGVGAAAVDTSGAAAAFGNGALAANTTGGNNSAFGRQALNANTTGANNVAVGRTALFSNTTGASNTAVGQAALNLNTTTGGQTAVGFSALGASIAASNTAVGSSALAGSTTGTDNVAIGRSAGVTQTVANQTLVGSRNTFIGKESGPNDASDPSDTVTLGYRAKVIGAGAVAIGSGAQALAAGSVALGMGTVCSVANQVKIDTRHLAFGAITDPGVAAANSGRLYLKNNGAGKMQLVVQMPTGSPLVIATEA